MKSFIPWIGGKSQLCKSLLQRFPADDIHRYIEIFGGAAWLLFAQEKHAPLEILNDLDGNLINLYRCIQHHCGELQRELRMGGEQIPPNSRELFFDYLEQLSVRGLTDIQRAARYFYIIRVSYGADRRTYGCNKKSLINAIDRLPEIQMRLKDVVIENRDFEAIIKAYDKPKALHYLDPPYYKAEKFYDGFSPDDHARLHTALSSIKGYFMLSYNDHPDIRKLYTGFNIEPIERHNSLASKKGANAGTYSELIIMNY